MKKLEGKHRIFAAIRIASFFNLLIFLCRTLATKFHVSWKEYWPFLDKFIDLRSDDGLKSLEEYLKQKIISEVMANSVYLKIDLINLTRTFSRRNLHQMRI